jgi:hypothetical protein
MIPNRFAFVALGMACIIAAAGGGYLATRQNAIPTPASATTVSLPAPAPAAPVGQIGPGTSQAADRSSKATSVPGTPVVAPTVGKRSEPRAATTTTQSARNIAAPAAAAVSRPPVQAPSDDRTPKSQVQIPSPPPTPVPTPAPPANDVSAPPRVEERVAQEPPRAPEPPRKTFEELVVAANSVIGLQTETRISSETARVEDRVEARVTRDVRVADSVAIPAGSRAIGSVTFVERGGKFKERARLGVRFETLVLPDGTRTPIRTETIYRDGEAPGNDSAAKIGGGAVAGTIIGAIIGGAKGAAIGATAGAGTGAAVVAAGDRSAATLPAGTPMTVRILAPVTVTIER